MPDCLRLLADCGGTLSENYRPITPDDQRQLQGSQKGFLDSLNIACWLASAHERSRFFHGAAPKWCIRKPPYSPLSHEQDPLLPVVGVRYRAGR